MSFQKQIEELRAEEIRLADENDFDNEWLIESSGWSEDQISEYEQRFSIKLPPDFRQFLASFAITNSSCEFALGRMYPYLFVSGWDEMANYTGERDFKSFGLLPIADDYSGHYFLCIEVGNPTAEGLCAVFEFDDQMAPSEESDLTPYLERLGDNFFEAARQLHKRFNGDSS